MKKKSLKVIGSILLTLALVASLCTVVWADDTVSDYASFKAAAEANTDAEQTYTLSGDVTLDTQDENWGYEMRFSETASKVTVDGNGHKITLGGSPQGYSWPNQTKQSPAGFTFVNVDANDSTPAGKTLIFKNINFE